MARNIQEFKYVDRAILSALILGSAALIANVWAHQLFPEENIEIGSLFIFWCAAALQPLPTLIAAGIGVFPESFFKGDYISAVRTLLLACTVSYFAIRRPRLPIFITVMLMWILIFGPILTLLGAFGLVTNQASMISIIYNATAEVVLAMISGTILLNRSVWGSIRHQPRSLSVSDILMHVLPLTVAVVLAISFSIGQGRPQFISFSLNSSQALPIGIMLAVCIISATLLGWRLATVLHKNLQEILAQSLLHSGPTQSFSGLSSDFWRRRSVTNLRRSRLFPETDKSEGGSDLNRQEDSTEHGICALNSDLTVSFLNQRFVEIAGVQDNNPLGKSLNALGLNPVLEENINRVLKRTTHNGIKTIEIKLNQLPDKLRFLELSTQGAGVKVPATLANNPGGILITVRDITDRRAVEHHLLKGQRQACLSNMVKGLVHSFNNSLATIIGNASAAQFAFNEASVRRSLKQISDAAQRASVLVRQLIDFADGRPSESKVGDLGRLIAQHHDLLTKLVGERIELLIDIPSQPIGSTFDPSLALQAITNLIVNAKEAIGSSIGTIRLSLNTETLDEEVADLMPGARPGDFVRLSISDTGSGMNPEVLAKAFEPLFTTKSTSGHPGLGLSVVYGIVRSLDGFLSMESHVGRGTTASIYLPLSDLKMQEPASNPLQSTSAGGHSHRRKDTTILVVEDDEHVREVVSGMLSTLGYQVSSCCDGAEALKQCQTTEFDLILTDMVMPHMSGMDLVAALQQNRKPTKALIMTAYGIQSEVAEGTKVLPKPFDIATLSRAVADLLNKETVSQECGRAP